MLLLARKYHRLLLVALPARIVGFCWQREEAEGFEPPVVLPTSVFETGAISQTRPRFHGAQLRSLY